MNARVFAIACRFLAGSLVALFLVAPAFANEPRESPRTMMVELKFAPFRPSLDSEFAAGQTPFEDNFGGSDFLLTRLEIDYQFLQAYGSLAAAGTIGYSGLSGHGILADGVESTDASKIHVLPLSLDAVYRMDIPAIRFGVPFVPYVKAGLDYYLWWITNGVGKVPNVTVNSGRAYEGKGGTWGGHVVFGVSFLLDVLAPDMAQIFDVDVGVNNTYIFAEYAMSWVDDFGSASSFDFSSKIFQFGVAFEF